jgi:putative transposon-encoded protein
VSLCRHRLVRIREAVSGKRSNPIGESGDVSVPDRG